MADADSTPVEYRDIPGFPGYRVGDDGSVWCCRGGGSHRGALMSTWRRRKPALNKDGYLRVYLWCNRKGKNYYVHRLVLEVFVGPCPGGMTACHNDGDSANNRLDNLRWDTQLANAADRVRHGTGARGTAHGCNKYTEELIREVRRLDAAGTPRTEIARITGIGQSYIRKIITRKTWATLL